MLRESESMRQRILKVTVESPAKDSPINRASCALAIGIVSEEMLPFMSSINIMEMMDSLTQELEVSASSTFGIYAEQIKAVSKQLDKMLLITPNDIDDLLEALKTVSVDILSIRSSTTLNRSDIIKLLKLSHDQNNLEVLSYAAIPLSTYDCSQIVSSVNDSNIRILNLLQCHLSDSEAGVLATISKKIFLNLSFNNIEKNGLSILYANSDLYIDCTLNPGTENNEEYNSAALKQIEFFLANQEFKNEFQKFCSNKIDINDTKAVFKFFQGLIKEPNLKFMNDLDSTFNRLSQLTYGAVFKPVGTLRFSTTNIMSSLNNLFTSNSASEQPKVAATTIVVKNDDKAPETLVLRTMRLPAENKPLPSPGIDDNFSTKDENEAERRISNML